MSSSTLKSQCSHTETIFNFLSSHTHPNEITNCETCGKRTECKILCSMPKDRTLRKICLSCSDIETVEMRRQMSEVIFEFKN